MRDFILLNRERLRGPLARAVPEKIPHLWWMAIVFLLPPHLEALKFLSPPSSGILWKN